MLTVQLVQFEVRFLHGNRVLRCVKVNHKLARHVRLKRELDSSAPNVEVVRIEVLGGVESAADARTRTVVGFKSRLHIAADLESLQ